MVLLWASSSRRNRPPRRCGKSAVDGRCVRAGPAYSAAARNRVRQLERRGYTHVFRFDIREFFDSVDHSVLQSRLADTMPGDVVALVMSLVRAPVVRANMLREVPKGLVLGTSLSPSLANHVLGPFDRSVQGVGPLVRYADDGVVAARSLQQATAAQERVAGALASLRLSINEQKSAVCSFQDGFQFLGVHFGGPDGVKATGAQR